MAWTALYSYFNIDVYNRENWVYRKWVEMLCEFSVFYLYSAIDNVFLVKATLPKDRFAKPGI